MRFLCNQGCFGGARVIFSLDDQHRSLIYGRVQSYYNEVRVLITRIID